LNIPSCKKSTSCIIPTVLFSDDPPNRRHYYDLGGTKSCSHLKELVEAIGPAVVQGVFSIMAENVSKLSAFMDDSQMRKGFAHAMVNSCYLWREDGPEIKKVFGLINE